MLAISLTLLVAQIPPAPSTQPVFSAATDLVTVQIMFFKSGRPVIGLTAKDFAVKVDKQAREIESVQYVTEAGRGPHYLLAFRPADADRGAGPRTAEITATITKREMKGKYAFTVPRR